MNAAILLELAKMTLEYEQKLNLTNALGSLHNALQKVSQNPQDSGHQTTLSSSLDETQKKLTEFQELLSNSDRERLSELGARDFFSPEWIDSVRAAIRENPMSPTVVQQKFAEQLSERNNFLKHTTDLSNNLTFFGFQNFDIELQEVHVGFQVPREIFSNSFEGFIKELNTLKFILSTISQISTGELLSAEIGQLSTSSPLIYLGVDFRLAAAFAACVTWSLDTWQRVQEIRDYRDLAPRIEALEEMTSDFDKIIEEQVDASIDEMIEKLKEKKSLTEEQESHARKSLRLLLERVERGMTVDFKMIAPSEEEPDEDESGSDSEDSETSQLRQIYETNRTLTFPEQSGAPVLSLTHENGSAESTSRKSRKLPKK